MTSTFIAALLGRWMLCTLLLFVCGSKIVVALHNLHEPRPEPSAATAPASCAAVPNLVQLLTSHEWDFAGSEQSPTPSRSFVLHFDGDGTFQRTASSDYTDIKRGAWACQRVSAEAGLLFMLGSDTSPSTARDRGQAEEVSLFRSRDDGSIQLGRRVLTPLAPTSARRNTVPRGLRTVEPTEEYFPKYFQLTKSHWARTDTKDTSFVADALTFQTDGSYKWGYRNGACAHEGSWSLEDGMLVIELPSAHCDTRSYHDPVVRAYNYSLGDGGKTLVLDDTYTFIRQQ